MLGHQDRNVESKQDTFVTSLDQKPEGKSPRVRRSAGIPCFGVLDEETELDILRKQELKAGPLVQLPAEPQIPPLSEDQKYTGKFCLGFGLSDDQWTRLWEHLHPSRPSCNILKVLVDVKATINTRIGHEIERSVC
ncbi:hypothetical protein EVJ58_g7875 [Rhodofomes roseus]|uniref:Uncharacterized protein n=1 Tax=Rhodofomes roseus TaxID=34475 RepID=A0A4Y9Y0U7_9APHY|nr:hypothetical protein EVJ58_g7875 [Rhodofomes roseus]